MTRRPAVARRAPMVLGLAFIVLVASALGWHFYQTGRGPALVEPSVEIERTNRETVPQYSLLEVDLRVEANFENPFDPEEVSVTAVFTSPSGRVIDIPAFYFQDFNRTLAGDEERLSASGDPCWKVRFAPTEIGEYTFHARLEDEGKVVTSSTASFSVSESDSRGFVGTSPRDNRYLQFDDGSSIFFIGHDVCWFGSKGTYDYDTYFSSMNLNGEKITRIWMAPWAFGIEWGELGVYNMAEAWRLDYVLEKANETDIYVLLCLMNHGQLQSGGDTGQWNDNPYSAAKGGPLANPVDFWKDETAIDLFKMRLRYIASRWGYSTQVLAWELWNEVELTDDYSFEVVAEWHDEMATYLRQIDPYGHLITTSSDPRLGGLDSMDLLTVHRYGPPGFLDIGGALHSMVRDLIERYEKPVLVSEFGADWRWSGDPYTTKDTEGVQIHNGIWSSIFSGSASSAMLWWWDNYIHPYDLYYHFKALDRFLGGIRPDTAGFSPLDARLIPPEKVDVEDLCDVKVYPSLGWARPEANIFEVDLYGEVTNVSQLGSFVQGNYHPELKNNPTFIVDLKYGGEATIHVNSVANSGAVLELYVDGLPAKTVRLTDLDGENDAAAGEYNLDVTVPVPPGRHEIRVDNSGNDWFTYDFAEFTKSALEISKARTIGLSNGTFAMVWIQNKDHTWWNAVNKIPVEALTHVDLELAGFADGEYTVEWWNTYDGEIIKQETVQAVDGKIPVSIERLHNDIAAKVYITEQ